MSKGNVKSSVQRVGRSLSGMVMPNIGAFVAWGLITALFIGTGWLPNEKLASLMRRFGICEERGSGVDKVVSQTEVFQLPPPAWETPDGFLRVTRFAHKLWRDMDKDDRVRACYLHACLRHVMRDPMTNSTLRQRFGIEPQNSATASRIIRDALDAGRIKPYDPDQGKKNSRYLPHWA